MSYSNSHLDADLELLYWKFDALVKGHDAERQKSGLGPMDEREAFKNVLLNWHELYLLQELSRTVAFEGGVSVLVHSILGKLSELGKKAVKDRG